MNYSLGTILRVDTPRGMKFMLVFDYTAGGTPRVAPLEKDDNGVPIVPDGLNGYDTYYKNLHWASAKKCYQVYGYPVKIYSVPSSQLITNILDQEK